jgi:hypothetical protein
MVDAYQLGGGQRFKMELTLDRSEVRTAGIVTAPILSGAAWSRHKWTCGRGYISVYSNRGVVVSGFLANNDRDGYTS